MDISQAKAAVALVMLDAAPDAQQILLIRRAEHPHDPWSGHWALPGGRRETCDRDLLATCIREAEEECGLQLDREAADQAMGLQWAGRAVGATIPVAVYAWHLTQRPALIPEPSEVQELHWLPCTRVRQAEQHELATVRTSHGSFTAGSIALPSNPLWGFTYRVICHYLQVPPLQEDD